MKSLLLIGVFYFFSSNVYSQDGLSEARAICNQVSNHQQNGLCHDSIRSASLMDTLAVRAGVEATENANYMAPTSCFKAIKNKTYTSRQVNSCRRVGNFDRVVACLTEVGRLSGYSESRSSSSTTSYDRPASNGLSEARAVCNQVSNYQQNGLCHDSIRSATFIDVIAVRACVEATEIANYMAPTSCFRVIKNKSYASREISDCRRAGNFDRVVSCLSSAGRLSY